MAVDASFSPTQNPVTSHARPARAPLLGPVAIAAVLAIALGWRNRAEHLLVPDEGLGYGLGVAGLAMMVLLLLYSPRKRMRALRKVGPIQRWFHIHMALGILGPTAILFHSNFQLGSLNANVALACMAVVSSSGLVGRFIYTRVHFEYMGQVATIEELRDEASHPGRVLAAAARSVPAVGLQVAEFRQAALTPRGSWPGRVAAFLSVGHRARRTKRRALAAWSSASVGEEPSTRELRRALNTHVGAIRRAAEYGAYERAFALWHALHLPFCVVMYVAAAVHVVAVHMY